MHAPFAQKASYRVLSHTSEDLHAEQTFPLEDIQPWRDSSHQYLQGASSRNTEYTPAPVWDNEESSGAQDGGGTANKGMYESSDPNRSSTKPDWLPYTLRWHCLALILAFTVLLEILVAIAHGVSARGVGLVTDDGSGNIVVLSKFVPTLFAVIHGILLSILLNDVRRTQPFANLASPSGAVGKLSIAWTANPWWETLIASFPKRRTKSTNWAMLCATVAFMFSFLLVSPFSSTFLVSEDVRFTQDVTFSQLDIAPALPLRGNPLATTYFRTASNVLQHVTTSAWITDKYAVLPFWPSEAGGSAPLGPIISDSVQTWTAKTTVFSVEMTCEKMDLVESRPMDWHSPEFTVPVEAYLARLMSPSGCTLNLTLPLGTDIAGGGAVWSDMQKFNSSDFSDGFNSPWDLHDCPQDDIFFMTKRLYDATAKNATIVGQTCYTHYYKGEPSVTVSLANTSSSVEINEPEYMSTREPIPRTVADLPSFERVFMNVTSWNIHLKKPASAKRAFASGPAVLLSAVYDFSIEDMMSDAALTQNMGRIKQRFFGELWRDVFDRASDRHTMPEPGTIAETKRRIVVVPAAAIILEVSLFLQIILLSSVLVATRLTRRPLGLFFDPAPPIRVAQLISSDASTLQSLENLHGAATSKELALSLSEKKYLLSNGQIHLIGPEIPEGQPTKLTPRTHELRHNALSDSVRGENQSFAFSVWMLISLILLLAAALITIAYLYWFSDAIGLYQTAFVYAFDVSVGGFDLGDVNPASLVTTLVAVSIGLWWGALDSVLRRVQPYLALAKKPISRSGSEAVYISYGSSYLLWATLRAVKRSHWILALVCTGAFLAEIFTIAMSSLWTRENGALPSVFEVPRQLELRHAPQLSPGTIQFTTAAGNYKQNALAELFGNMRTSWIYGAAIQTSLNGSEPAWSSDGWSFVPYDLSSVPSIARQNIGNRTEVPMSSTNATLATPGIRGRLECSPHQHLALEKTSSWLTEWDLTNTTQWRKLDNSSRSLTRAFELGLATLGDNTLLPLDDKPDIYGNYTSFFAQDKRFQCCENKTHGRRGMGSVGYWSPNLHNMSTYPDIAGNSRDVPRPWPTNFTVKWIHGLPVESYCSMEDPYGCRPRLLWAEKPRMSALNCMPIIETAEATVTVDVADGHVMDYVLHGEPVPDSHAWSYDFVQHQYNGSESVWAINITTSHGVLFVTGLFGASDIDSVAGNMAYSTQSENLLDQTFNIRMPGLNVDLMSYSMLSLVNYNHEALLDPDMLARTAQKTFSALFQSYASRNVSLSTGGYVFQPVGETLPADLDGPVNKTTRAVDTPPPGNTTVPVYLSHPVKLLRISKPAAWLCLIILAYLVLAGMALAMASRKYRTMLPRQINSIADAAVLMAGSHRFLSLVQETREVKNIRLDPNTRIRLGWFNDWKGTRRWGVEVVGEEQQQSTNKPNEVKFDDHDPDPDPPSDSTSTSLVNNNVDETPFSDYFQETDYYRRFNTDQDSLIHR